MAQINSKQTIIEVDSLQKIFKDIKAINGLTFDVKRGEIFGFLGPNGAGKTTTINILCTLLKPDGGHVAINHCDVVLEETKVRKFIGLVFQETILDTHLTVEENIYLHALLYQVEKKEFKKNLREVLKLVELWDWRKKIVTKLSGGMKRRLEIARALIHSPQILFLDEPTIGLDPQTRNKIWSYLYEMRKKEDLTIFLTTQYINEAESCDRVGIIDHGTLIALDKPENLKRLVGGDIITFRTENNELALEELKQKMPQLNAYRFGKNINLQIERGDEFLPRLIKLISLPIVSIELRHPTLEDVFLKLTGRRMRDEEIDNNHE